MNNYDYGENIISPASDSFTISNVQWPPVYGQYRFTVSVQQHSWLSYNETAHCRV